MSKPIYKRTELWGYGTIGAIGAALTSGQLTPDLIGKIDTISEQLPQLTTSIVALIDVTVESVLRIIGAVMALKSGLSYGRGRVAVKKARAQK